MPSPTPDLAQELAALQNALQSRPDSASVHERLSAVHEALGDAVAALRHYKRFHQLSLLAQDTGPLTHADLLARLPDLLALAQQTHQGLCVLALSPDADRSADSRQALAELLRRQCRQRDLVALQAPDALLLVLVDVDLPIARRVSERIRTAWGALGRSSLSMGLTAWRGGEDDAARLLDRADAALQAARRAGGNSLRSGSS